MASQLIRSCHPTKRMQLNSSYFVFVFGATYLGLCIDALHFAMMNEGKYVYSYILQLSLIAGIRCTAK